MQVKAKGLLNCPFSSSMLLVLILPFAPYQHTIQPILSITPMMGRVYKQSVARPILKGTKPRKNELTLT